MCSIVLKETFTYEVNHPSPVFCRFLDMSKATDTLHYCKLIKLLHKHGQPTEILRLIVSLYIYTTRFELVGMVSCLNTLWQLMGSSRELCRVVCLLEFMFRSF